MSTSQTQLSTEVVEPPWPKAGDILIKQSADCRLNSCVHLCRSLEGHCLGFEEAADLLVRHVLADQVMPNAMFRPVAFLYRHAVELRLKDVIAWGKALRGEAASFPAIHDLVALWRDAESLIVEHCPGGPKDDLEAVQAVIDQLSCLDPRADAFRFPVHRDGSLTLSTIDVVDMQNFSDVLKRVLSFLYCVGAQFQDWHENACDSNDYGY